MFSAAGCFANSGKILDCESSCNRGFGRSREGTDSGSKCWRVWWLID